MPELTAITGHKALQPGFIGYRRPDGSIVEPGSTHIDFELRTVNFDVCVEARGRYRVHHGPTFTHGARTLPDGQGRGILPSERHRIEMRCLQAVLRGIQQQVRDYNAAILPVDNGPDALVYLAETALRVSEAWSPMAERLDMAELGAACRANTFAGILAVDYLRNLPTTTTAKD